VNATVARGAVGHGRSVSGAESGEKKFVRRAGAYPANDVATKGWAGEPGG
jgi:hypothetical protein